MADHRLLHGFFDQDGAAYLEELEEALLLQGIAADTKPFPAARPETLEIFPSWPMRIQRGGAAVGIEKIEICDFLRIEIGSEDGNWQSGGSSESGPGQKAISQLESESGGSRKDDFSDPFWEKQRKQQLLTQQQPFGSKAETAGRLLQQSRVQDNKHTQMRQTAQKDGRSLDAKTLRRLAQNREAARKSRLRKKAYVQQLESSRMKLAQLEQDLQRARSQGFLVTGGCTGGGLSSGAAIFDLEYAQWLDENYKHMAELQGGLQAHLPDGNLRVIVDECLKHYDEIFRLKDVAVKSDVFHLITGMWTTPAERCFLWVGGFRPSDLLKILMPHLDPLTEQQIVGICNLQQSSQQAEEALSQGMDQLQQSLADTVARGYLCEDSNVGNYMGQMAVALGKIRDIEGFVRQADNLRQQTLHQLRRILTIRQTARCFLAIGEHNSRLRALSSLWSSRPRENSVVNENDYPATTNLQILQPLDAHFSVF